MKSIICAACKCAFGIPDALYEVAHARKTTVYCPYGHGVYWDIEQLLKEQEANQNINKIVNAPENAGKVVPFKP